MFNVPNLGVLAPIEDVANNENLELPKLSTDNEPNNDYASAESITPGEYFGLSCYDDDWYFFWADLDDLICVEILFIHDDGNLQLTLYYQGPNWRAESFTENDNEMLSYKADNAGWYYIQIYSWTTPNPNYALRIDVIPPQIIFEDDFESGVKPKWSGWASDNFWHITDRDYMTTPSYNHSLWCGNETSGYYNKQDSPLVFLPYKDVISIEHLNLTDYKAAYLDFYYRKSTAGSSDTFGIFADVNSQNLYFHPKYVIYEIELLDCGETAWTPIRIDLSVLCGYDDVGLDFVFDCDAFNNNWTGVFLDDINITGHKRITQEGFSLGFAEGDVFIYYIEKMHASYYLQTFGKAPFGNTDQRLKLEIHSIFETSEWWKIEVFYWEPGNNFGSYGAADLIDYKVYKHALNKKGGTDFFIPNNNLILYCQRADNDPWGGGLGTGVDIWYDDWDQKYVFNYRIWHNEIDINMEYNEDGILKRLNVWKSGYDDIYTIYLEKEEENNNNNYNPFVTIPGYDFIMTISIIFALTSIIIIKFKKRIKI